ncbi:TPA: DNA primase [Streptococcus pyogenes]|uniref:DNA primase n=2 Tax=Streptococcus pyogenes TaxID=1314 RepID=A0ABD7UTF1_STRPY|nr:DNA primase [Streptococcus pyogenes]EPZ47940.1 DNA primase [Streptococcus pyogenes GA41345]HEP6222965.1 DNA primase [Streptococcus pyogenes ABC020014327]HEP6227475.1 DNA primase [Streptococcus pyogenes ABC020056369]HEP6229663.1 DNA primase [Streptococcus pyogenes ABC020013891]HEP6230390.1 DNA primase [Streptococcus pyogenes ABC020041419]HEP6231503.1 DNA primase [Streptococcus pyogenes ABC020060258]HEP6238327.1 DNA primase [Streptococcus pyogenes ABC020034029]HEP6239997.1 DNA primase [Str
MGFLWGGDDLAIDKEMISQVKNSVNIVDVIGEVVKLSRSGRHYLGLCPFHKEKTPSFNVVEDRQFFHCFGCGKSGDVFKFIEEYRQVPFLESVQIIADKTGMSLNIPPSQAVLASQHKHPNHALMTLHEDAAKFYHAVLMTTTIGQEARKYLYQRGLDDQLIEHFNIGLAPDESDYLYQALSKKYEEGQLVASGLFHLSDQSNTIYDAFRNRIMFPLSDDRGHIIAFSGRIWTAADMEKRQAKYKNSRGTVLFNKSYELYHLDKARPVIAKTHEVFLMEGFMDVIAAYRSGYENAVASMGTALTQEHVNHLKQVTKKVVLIYDGDDAGQHAIAKSLELLKDFVVEIVRIPNKMDPDEFVQRHSPEAFADLLKQSRISSVEFFIDYLKPTNVDNLQSQIVYVEKMAPLIAQSPSITAQHSYINKISDLLPNFDYFQVEQSVNALRIQDRQKHQGQIAQAVSNLVTLPMPKSLTAIAKTESHLMHRLLHHDYLLNEFRHRDDFYFDTSTLELLYQRLKQQGHITSYDLSEMSEEVNRAYYNVLEENLPKEVALGEIDDILSKRAKLLAERDLHKQGKKVRESSNKGDHQAALEVLEHFIAQKRKME